MARRRAVELTELLEVVTGVAGEHRGVPGVEPRDGTLGRSRLEEPVHDAEAARVVAEHLPEMLVAVDPFPVDPERLLRMTGRQRVVDELFHHEEVVATDRAHLQRALVQVLAHALVDRRVRALLHEPVVEVILHGRVERECGTLHVEEPQVREVHERGFERRAIHAPERRAQACEHLAEALLARREEDVVEHVGGGARSERGEPLEDRGLGSGELVREPLEDHPEARALTEPRVVLLELGRIAAGERREVAPEDRHRERVPPPRIGERFERPVVALHAACAEERGRCRRRERVELERARLARIDPDERKARGDERGRVPRTLRQALHEELEARVLEHALLGLVVLLDALEAVERDDRGPRGAQPIEEGVDAAEPDEPCALLAEVGERLRQEVVDVRVLVEGPEEDARGNVVANLVEEPVQQHRLAGAAHADDRDDPDVEVCDPFPEERELGLASLEVALAGKDVLDVGRTLLEAILGRNAEVRRERLALVVGEPLEAHADARLAFGALGMTVDHRRAHLEGRQRRRELDVENDRRSRLELLARDDVGTAEAEVVDERLPAVLIEHDRQTRREHEARVPSAVRARVRSGCLHPVDCAPFEAEMPGHE